MVLSGTPHFRSACCDLYVHKEQEWGGFLTEPHRCLLQATCRGDSYGASKTTTKRPLCMRKQSSIKYQPVHKKRTFKKMSLRPKLMVSENQLGIGFMPHSRRNPFGGQKMPMRKGETTRNRTAPPIARPPVHGLRSSLQNTKQDCALALLLTDRSRTLSAWA